MENFDVTSEISFSLYIKKDKIKKILLNKPILKGFFMILVEYVNYLIRLYIFSDSFFFYYPGSARFQL